MSEVGLQVDPYLRQVVPVLQTCKQAVCEITKRDLHIQGEDRGVLVFHFIFELVPNDLEAKRARSRNTSGTDVKTDIEALGLIEQVKVFADKLRDVTFRVLDAKEEMKKADITLSRKIKKIAELKKRLNEFTRLLDTIVTFYSARFLGFHSTVNLPPLEEVKKLKVQLSQLKSKLKKDELSSEFASCDAEFNISNEVMICSILGLRDGYGLYLQEMDPEMKMHQSILYYLKKWIKSEEDELESDGFMHHSGKKVLEENLYNLGFSKEIAKIITQHIPDEFVDLQKPSFWAARYLDHVYCHHPLMSCTPRYLYSQHLVDEWFEIELTLDSDEMDFDVAQMKDAGPVEHSSIEIRDSEVAKLGLTETNSEDEVVCAVKMINISSDKSQGNVLVEKLLKDLKSDESCLFFHGTTHKDAIGVITGGFDYTGGSKMQDFSMGDGFYLSDKFENAKAWSQAGRGEHQAIVVYNVKRSLLNEGNGLDLSQNPARWEEVVRCFRNGFINEKITKDIQKYAFIEGPPCKNPADSNGTNPLLPYEEAGIQLCIRDDLFGEVFGSATNVACVIFY